MARNIGADGSTIYRAVIQKTYEDGRTWTAHEGPYTEPGPARARLTFWRNRMARRGGTAHGHVEQAHTTWAPVGEDPDPTDAIRAQAYRDAADEITAEYTGPDRDRAARAAADFLRRRADHIHPAAQEPTP
ncbi:hypothetical protein [Streptomyces sp. TP-A0875]|uniref:hypothetical protein n=1 Tax=Streptomyces sp. TP-A0875 TaxID=552354 RepID=UPI0006B40F4D|nr:hypothetical protein [Streptomyces sp. TP-A0875]